LHNNHIERLMRRGDPDAGPVSGSRATSVSLAAMNWLNFLTALMQTAFGAFLSVYLTTNGWSATDIGAVLGVGTVVAIACQVPGGALLDWLHRARLAASLAVAAIMASATLMAIAPYRIPVVAAEFLQGAGASVLTLAIAALTLAISRHEKLGEKFGHNVRYAAVGSAVAAMAIAAAARFSDAAGFWLAVACGVPALVAVWAIRVSDIEAAPTHTTHITVLPRHARPRPLHPPHALVLDRAFLVFAGCMMLFHLGNAALLPTAARAVAQAGAQANLAIGVAIMVPQLLAAAFSPWVGRLANHHGRRGLLLVGFATLPVRALLFAFDSGPMPMALWQTLDGISAAVFGVIVPLTVANMTHRRGHFNLAMGAVGLLAALGATTSTVGTGVIADILGSQAAFLALAVAGVVAWTAVWCFMPETHPSTGQPSVAPTPA
jgi:MFS family permease